MHGFSPDGPDDLLEAVIVSIPKDMKGVYVLIVIIEEWLCAQRCVR